MTWAVSVEIVVPGSEEWGSVALALAAKRLNASGPAATVAGSVVPIARGEITVPPASR